MRIALLLALACSIIVTVGCSIPTWAVVRRFESDRFRACRIEVGWWAQELIDECGEPTWIRRRIAPGDEGNEVCAGYSSSAISGGPGEIAAAQVVACLGGSGRKTRAAPPLTSTSDWLMDADAAKTLVVRGVYLVSEGPTEESGPETPPSVSSPPAR